MTMGVRYHHPKTSFFVRQARCCEDYVITSRARYYGDPAMYLSRRGETGWVPSPYAEFYFPTEAAARAALDAWLGREPEDW